MLLYVGFYCIQDMENIKMVLINLHIVHLDACYIFISHGDAGLSSNGFFISIVLKWVDLHFSFFLSFLITV